MTQEEEERKEETASPLQFILTLNPVSSKRCDVSRFTYFELIFFSVLPPFLTFLVLRSCICYHISLFCSFFQRLVYIIQFRQLAKYERLRRLTDYSTRFRTISEVSTCFFLNNSFHLLFAVSTEKWNIWFKKKSWKHVFCSFSSDFSSPINESVLGAWRNSTLALESPWTNFVRGDIRAGATVRRADGSFSGFVERQPIAGIVAWLYHNGPIGILSLSILFYIHLSIRLFFTTISPYPSLAPFSSLFKSSLPLRVTFITSQCICVYRCVDVRDRNWRPDAAS